MELGFTLSHRDDYLLITSSGMVEELEELKLLHRRYCEEIAKSGFNKIIVDELDLKKPLSLLLIIDLIESYKSGYPQNMKEWSMAIIVEKGYRQMAEFWEFNVRNMGYDFRIFNNIADAMKFLGVACAVNRNSRESEK